MRREAQIPPSEITPLSTYLNRRALMNAGLAAASLTTTGWVYRCLNRPSSAVVDTPALANLAVSAATPADVNDGFHVDESMTPLQSISNYNNFYEFTTSKEGVASAEFVSKPWRVAVDGLVHKPKVFDLDEI